MIKGGNPNKVGKVIKYFHCSIIYVIDVPYSLQSLVPQSFPHWRQTVEGPRNIFNIGWVRDQKVRIFVWPF